MNQEEKNELIRKYPECELCGKRSGGVGYIDISDASEAKWLVIPVCVEHIGPRGKFQLEDLRTYRRKGLEIMERWVNAQGV